MQTMFKSNAEPHIISQLAELSERTAEISARESHLATPFVLILGTDTDTRFLFRTACEIWDYDVVEADNCQQCLSVSAFKVPNLILIDSEIDFQKSLAAMMKLQKSPLFKDCGFVFISGHAQESVKEAALQAGANFFLVKPVDFDLLKRFLRNYFRHKNLAVSNSR